MVEVVARLVLRPQNAASRPHLNTSPTIITDFPFATHFLITLWRETTVSHHPNARLQVILIIKPRRAPTPVLPAHVASAKRRSPAGVVPAASPGARRLNILGYLIISPDESI